MLSTLRLASRRALPRIFPSHARAITTDTAAKQREEAMGILGNIVDPFATPAPGPAAPKPKLDLENMHHHVPAAESPLLQFLTTMIMKHGEYAKAQRIVSNMLLHVRAMTGSPPMPIVEQAIMAAAPAVKSRKRKQRGGKSSMVPLPLNERQRIHMALKWIRDQVIHEKKARGAPGKKYEERLAREMIAIVRGTSPVLAEKKKTHEEAMVNRGSLAKR
ncbi:hypothetical protein HYPSUDRAFT_205875 [Hypholoma sublateritium FD-334 SS-4]|uniref:Small ribosomal subunit protein uS7 domain-containing protein n=1 Tax=Hypholoma sublateritium (strain FD-334 SS-4) TaxID=945553 RepID=A0A0D2NM67_HYPSF|nr:hypothetical protein HYPSUDRAFT_205875 [Hypholoma sublateritium FD-334 SS-4]